MRDKFMFFDNFKETADRLPDDLRLKFYDAMTDYVFKGAESDDAIISALITAIKPSLDKEDKRGGNHNPLGQNQYSEVKKEVKEVKSGQSGQSFLETETETRNRNKKLLTPENNKLFSSPKGETKKFVKPTLEEIKTYCLERKNNVDPEKWLDYYESNGWKVGRNSMKDWRAAVRTWEKSSLSASASCKTADDAEFWAKVKREAESYERENQAN